MLMDPLGPLRLDWRYLPKAAPWLMRLLWNLRSSPYQRSVSGIRALNEVSLAAWQELLASIGRSDLLCGQGSLLVHEKAETADAWRHRRHVSRRMASRWNGWTARKSVAGLPGCRSASVEACSSPIPAM